MGFIAVGCSGTTGQSDRSWNVWPALAVDAGIKYGGVITSEMGAVSERLDTGLLYGEMGRNGLFGRLRNTAVERPPRRLGPGPCHNRGNSFGLVARSTVRNRLSRREPESCRRTHSAGSVSYTHLRAHETRHD